MNIKKTRTKIFASLLLSSFTLGSGAFADTVTTSEFNNNTRTGSAVSSSKSVSFAFSQSMNLLTDGIIQVQTAIDSIDLSGEFADSLENKLKTLPNSQFGSDTVTHSVFVSGFTSFDEEIIFTCFVSASVCSIEYTVINTNEFVPGMAGIGPANNSNYRYDSDQLSIEEAFLSAAADVELPAARNPNQNGYVEGNLQIIFDRTEVAEVLENTLICDFDTTSASEDIGGGGSSSNCLLEL